VKGGGDIVPREVSHDDPNTLIREGLNVIQIAAHGVGLNAPPGNLQTANACYGRWQELFLHLTSRFQLSSVGFDLGGDGARHGVESFAQEPQFVASCDGHFYAQLPLLHFPCCPVKMPNRAKNRSVHDQVHDSDEEQSRADQPGGVAQET
jgi:hypothetical protein